MIRMKQSALLVVTSLAFLPTVASDSGDDFTNNLFSDLAPLLALFGERGAQQFMSQSMSLVECVIFAMAPLGLLTAVVGAIRIGGSGWLKAFIGRAREAYSVPELELLSSTSSEVCELWNGLTLVRVLGSPRISELVYFPKADSEDSDLEESLSGHCGIDTTSRTDLWSEKPSTSEYIRWFLDGQTPYLLGLKDYFSRNPRSDVENPTNTNDVKRGGQKSPVRDGEESPAAKPSAPNISLNITKSASQKQLWAVALAGVVLQCAVLIFDAFSVYHPTWKGRFMKSGREVEKHAFPLTAFGTVLVVLGMFICAYVIEDATREGELEYKKNEKGTEMRVMWLQKYENVGDQNFDSYAIFAQDKRTSIRTSRRREPQFSRQDQPSIYSQSPQSSKPAPLSLKESSRPESVDLLSTLTAFATATTFIGFVTQFMGLRAMSWTATIVQLVATVVMTFLRSWLTTAGLSQEPNTCKLPKEYELDWLATRIGDFRDGLYENLADVKMDAQFWGQCSWKWRVVTERHRTAESWSKLPSDGRANKVVEARKRLLELTEWAREGNMAASVASAIEEFMNSLCNMDFVTLEAGFTELLKFEWPVFIEFDGVEESYYLQLSRDSTMGKWKADSKSIEAILSLWTYALQTIEKEKEEDPEDPRQSEGLFEKERAGLGEVQKDLKDGSCERLRFLGPGDATSQKSYRLWIYRGTDFKIFRRKDAKTKHNATGFPVNPSLSTQRRTTDIELDETISISTTSPLESICAQDLFSTFVWYIADKIKVITPKTTLAKNTLGMNQEAWQPPSFRNPFLENILRSIETTGLGTTEEIYMCIIPPLHSSGILYDIDFGSQGLIEYVDERAGLFKAREDWEEAGKAYKWLYDTCLGYLQTEPSAFCKAAILLAHFSASIIDATASCDSYNMCPDLKRQKESSLSTIASSALEKVLSGPQGQDIHRILENAYESAGGIHRLPKTKITPDTRDTSELPPSATAQGLKTDERPLEDIVRDLLFPDPKKKSQNFLGWTALHIATTTGVKDLKDLLRTSASGIDARDRDGRTPLHWAVLSRQIESAEILLEAGCNEKIGDKMEMAPLHLAVMRHRKDIVISLLRKNIDIEIRNSKGWTVLHLAASAGFQDEVELLLKHDAEIEARDTRQRTPLHLAAMAGKGNIIKTLLEGKANKDAEDSTGSTALHLAAQSGYEVEVTVLLEKGANIEARDLFKRTPLHVAVIAGQRCTAELLLENGANIESRDSQEATALHLAAQQGLTDEVIMLLDKGADIDAKDIVGETPLLRAFANKRHDVIRILLERNANANATSCSGDSTLYLAACWGNLEIARLLLEYGAHRNLNQYQGGGDGFQKVVKLCSGA